MFKLFKTASGVKTDLLHLKKLIREENELAFKEWFFSKLEELEKQ